MNVPDEMLAKLLAVAAAQGIDLGVSVEGSEQPDDAPAFPAVSLNRATSDIAHETGMNLKRSGLYVYQGRLVTIKEDGRDEEMDMDRFLTWVDGFQVNYYKRRPKKEGEEDDGKLSAPIKATMKANVAKPLLKSDLFRAHLPEIRRILPVSLPVFDHNEEGHKILRMLPVGYDEASKVYTCDRGVNYSLDWPLEKAVAYLRDLLKDFPFADTGRSLAVQISGMLTIYCQLLFPELDRFPMIYFNANNPGSGKSRLGEMMVYPIYGEAEMMAFTDNDEFVKVLDTWAQSGRAYTFIDDVSGLVKSNVLNRWMTSPTWGGRVMHSQRMFRVINQTLTLLTGNQATLSDDLGRRSLMIDLWSGLLAADRQGDLSKVIDQEWLAAVPNRVDMLSALHALVAHWAGPDGEMQIYKKLIPSFEGWSRIIPSIVTLAGFDCPLQPAAVDDAGQKQEVEFRRLVEAAVRDYFPEIGKAVDILLVDWCRIARHQGLFHSVVSDLNTAKEMLEARPSLYKLVKQKDGTMLHPSERDKEDQAYRYMDKGMSTKFAGLLHKFYRGRILKYNEKYYRFANRKARHSTFALEQMRKEDVK